MTARIVVLVVVTLAMLLGFGAIIITGPSDAARFVPASTPSPSGWRYGD